MTVMIYDDKKRSTIIQVINKINDVQKRRLVTFYFNNYYTENRRLVTFYFSILY